MNVTCCGPIHRETSNSPRAVTISIAREKGQPAFTYELAATFEGRPIEGGTTKDRCDRCSPEDVVRRLSPVLDLQLALLKASTKADGASDAPQPSDGDGPETGPNAGVAPGTPPAGPDSRQHRKVGRLGWAGLGVAIGGVAIAGAGVGLIVRPDRVRVDPSMPQTSTEKSTQRPGVALATVGGGAVVAGIVMLAVDQSKLKHKRRRVAWAPSWAPGYAGFDMKGRF